MQWLHVQCDSLVILAPGGYLCGLSCVWCYVPITLGTEYIPIEYLINRPLCDNVYVIPAQTLWSCVQTFWMSSGLV